MLKDNPEHNPYYQSDIRDAIRTRKWLRGEDMRNEAKWIVKEKNIPCAWYAISTLAPQNGIKCLHRFATQSRDGYWNAVAICKKGDGIFASTRMGASTFHDKQMALAFACRNAIKWLLPMQPNTGEKVAWAETKDRAAEREGIHGAYA